MGYENPWIFEGKIFDSSDIKDYYGFVYQITDTFNNKKYIGRKYFWSLRKDSKRKKIKKESDWKDYYSSSKVINSLINQFGEHRFKREILSLHKTKGETNY